ncbi:DUF2236 domain-containing protein [Nocardia panacis]|uniref:DUF2236 domain-containing protein n=1 Tax=Nocardia panacis TaxID=2340916 RepID=A0A3A4KGW3_9NOCA|nr:oxygenase MpaB family protein [Nocardia panacis]RJO73709.1 DUF2236 domain-containing protein [Nocardia panacis]
MTTYCPGTPHYPRLARRAHDQRSQLAALYGAIDFDAEPHRFTTDPTVESTLPRWVAERAPILADDRLVELIRTATLLGDVIADPYAALAQRYTVAELIDMLRRACRSGIDSVVDAPPELRTFLAAMEATPPWIDLRLVEEGARYSRLATALLAPFLARGAFLATFLNTYAALPMALTGALSGRRAARRVNETAGFFTVTTLPGALTRHGAGFEAAAMVRLMHSLVRYHALTHPEQWDHRVYGVPVPQIDQVPAGLVDIYLLAMSAARRGRTEFGARERAMLEFSRYRCFLLGLPEELLPTTATGVIELLHARAALLRDGFDDATCGALVRSTMSAYLRPGRSWFDRAADAVERSWSRAFFLGFCGGNRKQAAGMSVGFGIADAARVLVTAPFILGRFLAVLAAGRWSVLRDRVDEYTIGLVRARLTTYGVPEFTAEVRDPVSAHRHTP